MKRILFASLFFASTSGFLGCAATDDAAAVDDSDLTSSTRITCASDTNRFVSCTVDTQQGKIVRAQLARQLSSAACTSGTSWGFDRDRVWVDKGCRGQFDVTFRKGPETTRTIGCASNDNRRRRCSTGFEEISAVRLMSQQSTASCTEGTSWGHDETGVWVDRGCRATFEVRGFGGAPPPVPVDPPVNPPASGRVTLHRSSGCTPFSAIATLTADTDCASLRFRTVRSAFAEGVCRAENSLDGEAACRIYKPRPSGPTAPTSSN